MSYADAASKNSKQSPEEDLKQSASDAASSVEQKAGEAKDKSAQESSNLKQRAGDYADSAEKSFEKGKGQAKDKAKAAEKDIKGEYNDLYENRDNPVIIGNAVAIVAGAAGLGYGAYAKHVKGELNWEVAGLAAAGVAAIGVADYFLSSWLIQNKYPKRSGPKY